MTAEQPNASLTTIRDAFDARAASYDDSTMHRAVADAVADFAELGDVEDVLDIATGTGLVLRALARRSPAMSMTGVDVSLGMLEVARKYLRAAKFIEADAAHLPLADASADLITCVTGLHVIPDTAAALYEWHRLLRPGGRAISATFITGRRKDFPRVAHTYPANHRPFETLERLSTTAAEHGFTISRSTTWTDHTDRLLIAEWVSTGR